MKRVEDHLKWWLWPAVSAAWTVFLLILMADRSYTLFLRPEFGVLLALAHLIAMGFMLTAMIRTDAPAANTSDALRALVLLVPILYAIALPDATLGSHAFQKRFVGPAGKAVNRSARSPAPAFPPSEAGRTGPETLPDPTIVDIYRTPDRYDGKEVTVIGMILSDEHLKPYFGGMNTAIYRFLITCCVADALPLAIALDSDRAESLANDQWVRVEGTFELREVEGRRFPVISPTVIQPIEQPAVTYLF